METERPGQKTMGAAASGRLGGARADFVASLGRKVSDARAALSALERAPDSKGPRDDLRRRLHAMGAGARLLRFEALGTALAKAESLLDVVTAAGTASTDELTALAKLLDDLPALAWDDAPERRKKEAPPAERPTPLAALVVGEDAIAMALAESKGTKEGDAEATLASFACERTGDPSYAMDIARGMLPDVVVVDGDIDGATELVEQLLDEPVTDAVPIVVLTRGTAQDRGARFVALGVARTLAKPVSAEELAKACRESIEQHVGRTERVTLGEPTIEQLAERLSDEMKRALVDAVEENGKNRRIPLGAGTEVLAAVWGAVARVREVVSARSEGAVRFVPFGPEGAIALAPWLHPDGPGAERWAGRGRGAALDVKLDGRRVVVADDDPGVTWFIADLLRTAGCVVHEAFDGEAALDLAFKVSPELVVSDVLMPKMDGFALCRALKHDVALRDTPIILLSWKEDLLQRVRELGAGASAYLRKESDARAILSRVREAMWPRARIENRLRESGEVRGRLDGITVSTLLQLVCAARVDARVTLRDATHLYEVEIRGGAPRRTSRTTGDGMFERGPGIFAAMLGIGSGRFVVAPAADAIDGDAETTLAEQLAEPLAAARGAARVLTGARMAGVDGVGVDLTDLASYLRATFEPARGLVTRLAEGGSPRRMLLDGEVAPALLEELLVDLAGRGAVREVRSASGADLLGPAIAAVRAAMSGTAPAIEEVQPAAKPAAGAEHEAAVAAETSPEPDENDPSSDDASDAVASAVGEAPVAVVAAVPAVAEGAPVVRTPSSLGGAVLRELRGPSTKPPPIVDPSELRPRPSLRTTPEPSVPVVIESSPQTPMTTSVGGDDAPTTAASTSRRRRERRWTSLFGFFAAGAVIVTVARWPHAQTATAAASQGEAVAAIPAPRGLDIPPIPPPEVADAPQPAAADGAGDVANGGSAAIAKETDGHAHDAPPSPPTTTTPARSRRAAAAAATPTPTTAPTASPSIVATWGTAPSPIAVPPATSER